MCLADVDLEKVEPLEVGGWSSGIEVLLCVVF